MKEPFQAAFSMKEPVTYTFVENDIEVSKEIVKLFESVPKGKFQAEIIRNKGHLTTENIQDYHNFQGLINHCANNAESVNRQLRDFILVISRPEDQQLIMDKTFKELKGIFSNFFHTCPAVREQEKYNTTKKRKVFTKTLEDYISDRNIYTHGCLLLRDADRVFILEIIEEKRTIQVEVSIIILQSFLEITELLRVFLSEVRRLVTTI